MTDLIKALSDVRANKPITGTKEFINQVAIACIYEMRGFVGAETASPKKTAENLVKLAKHIKADIDFVNAYWIASRMATIGEPTSNIQVNTEYDEILQKILMIEPKDGAVIKAHITSGEVKNANYEANSRIIHIRKKTDKNLFAKAIPMLSYKVGNYCVDIYQNSKISGVNIDVKILANVAESIPLMENVKIKRQEKNIDFDEIRYSFEDRKPAAIVSDVYSEYNPDRITVQNAKGHPAKLVESRTIAAIRGPKFNSKVLLPKNAIEKGSVSGVQAEAIIMAVARHEKFNSSDERMGFFIGDSTGVGKTNEQIGIIADSIAKGEKRNIYFTEKESHLENVKKALKMIGLSPSLIIQAGDYKRYDELPKRDGILFITYNELGQKDEIGQHVRVEQIQNWIGEDFNGNFMFDESHNLANAVAVEEEGGFGANEISDQAVAAINLQAANPKARVTYCSATGISRPSNIAYMTRLNIWGENQEYTDPANIIHAISKKGLSALEVLNTHLISSGSAISRSISLQDVKYDMLIHSLTEDDSKLWDTVTGILREIRSAMPNAYAQSNMSKKRESKPGKNTIGYYEGSCRRIAEMLMMTIKLPTLKKHIQTRIDHGETAVIQLMNTYETLTSSDGEALKSSIQAIIQYCLPRYMRATEKMSGIEHDYHVDKAGEFVKSPFYDNIVSIEKLLDTIPSISNPIDSLIATFGTEQVAEITGRTKRAINVFGVETIEARTRADVKADLAAFMSDKKRILIFSTGAGGSSMDYHASMDALNQRLRNHYILQYGQKATQAIQGIGRTHRSHQAQAPVLWLVSSNLPSEKIYRSQIINRIRNVGAVNHGNRDASSQSFSNADNYDSATASAGIMMYMKNVVSNKYSEMSYKDFANITNLDIEEKGVQFATRHRILSRIARCTIAHQNLIMNLIDREIVNVIEKKIEDRTFDTGPEYIDGQFEKGDVRTLYESEKYGSKITATDIKGDVKIKISSFREAYEEAENYAMTGLPPKILFDPKSGRVLISSEIEEPSANSEGTYRIIEPHFSKNANAMLEGQSSTFNVFSVRTIRKNEAEPLWASYAHEIEKRFENDNLLISGSIMASPSFFFKLNLKPVVVEFKDKTQQFGLLCKQSEIASIEEMIAFDHLEKVSSVELQDNLADMRNGKYLILESNGVIHLEKDKAGNETLNYTPHIKNIPDIIINATNMNLAATRIAGQTKFFAKGKNIASALSKILNRRENKIKETVDHPDWSITMS